MLAKVGNITKAIKALANNGFRAIF